MLAEHNETISWRIDSCEVLINLAKLWLVILRLSSVFYKSLLELRGSEIFSKNCWNDPKTAADYESNKTQQLSLF